MFNLGKLFSKLNHVKLTHSIHIHWGLAMSDTALSQG